MKAKMAKGMPKVMPKHERPGSTPGHEMMMPDMPMMKGKMPVPPKPKPKSRRK